MSTEPRRIKRIVRRYNNPLLTQEEIRNAQRRADARNAAQRALAYAITKARVVEGFVTLPQLAAERGIQAQLARLWIKRAGIKKPRDRWVWAEGSKALGRARKALGLKP